MMLEVPSVMLIVVFRGPFSHLWVKCKGEIYSRTDD